MSAKVYLNGELKALEDACIPVMDRGFLFGDSVYEVIPAYGGRLFRLTEHLDRLTNSLHAIHMQNPLSHEQWNQVLTALVAQHPGRDQGVYLQVTRGPAPVRDHAVPSQVTPTVFAMTRTLEPQPPEKKSAGIAAITLEDIRWKHCDIKATTLLANVLARQQAAEEGAMEAILVRDGLATEGAASNLFIVKDGLLVTPPKSAFMLPGITRDLVLELAAAAGIPYAEATISAGELEDADEVWLTSSTKEVMPVVSLNGRPVGTGEAGPLWHRMNALYGEYKERIRDGKGETA